MPRLEDLDGLDIRLLAPAAGTVFGQHTVSCPFSAAMGRHALGPELTWRVRGEVDHHAMAVEAAHAGAFVRLAVLVLISEGSTDQRHAPEHAQHGAIAP